MDYESKPSCLFSNITLPQKRNNLSQLVAAAIAAAAAAASILVINPIYDL
jgi:hypothetical protein